jgi:NAD(P)-dependent dehydrogenase (short-subunit alcohol dehydrogenase family)
LSSLILRVSLLGNMSRTIVISGGNSGIGLEAARQLAREGHRVILLARDPAKGAAAVESIRSAGGSAEFHAVDLSTHAGVKAAAELVASAHPEIDGLILGAGTLTTKDVRTTDGLHVVFATNYLSRYHLAQRLLPQLRAAGTASVVLLVAGVPLDSRIDFQQFPKYQPFPGMRALPSIQIANYHYAAWLAAQEPTIHTAVVNVGLVRTEIMRNMPAAMRFLFAALGPLITIPVEQSAKNAVYLSTHEGWRSGSYWPKPGKLEVSRPLQLDEAVTGKVIEASRELTGA